MKNILTNDTQSVIFDMDGTIMDSIPYHLQSWQFFFEKHGLPFERAAFQTQNHGNLREMIRFHVNSKMSDEEATVLGNEKEQIYRDIYAENICEIEGLTSFLEKLKNRNIKIALATMADQENIDFVLGKLNIRKYFHSISGGHEVKLGKPAPDIFNLALERLQLSASECIVFEDSLGGVQAAVQAGIKVIGVTTSHTSEELMNEGCFYAIANYCEL